MKTSQRPVVTALSMLVFWMGPWAFAMAPANTSPYQPIVERNVFGLKPPTRVEPLKPPALQVRLQGITTILGYELVILKFEAPPRPSKGEQSFVLAKGQRAGDIEVLDIDATAGKVKVQYSGSVMDLDFENNGIKAPGGVGVPVPVTSVVPTSTQKILSTTVILSPEEAAIMEAAYRLKNADAIKNGTMPDIPGSSPVPQ